MFPLPIQMGYTVIFFLLSFSNMGSERSFFLQIEDPIVDVSGVSTIFHQTFSFCSEHGWFTLKTENKYLEKRYFHKVMLALIKWNNFQKYPNEFISGNLYCKTMLPRLFWEMCHYKKAHLFSFPQVKWHPTKMFIWKRTFPLKLQENIGKTSV